MPDPSTVPPASQIQPWRGGVLPAGPWRRGHQWTARAACRAPDVDPAWFTVDEDAPDAAELIAKAKGVCLGCPARLWCRVHADETGNDGVDAAETQRIRRQRAWRHAVAAVEAAEQVSA